MIDYKLLTPGPLTTSDTVKREMLVDHCTWDDDYKQITQMIRKKLLELAHVSRDKYTAVLMQGSGTFGVESVITSAVGPEDKVLICANGAYGERQADICEHAGIAFELYCCPFDEQPDPAVIEHYLRADETLTHVSMVHSETTSGILNDIASVAAVTRKYHKIFIVDAMSSFGGVDIDVGGLGIDFIVSSANKCIQGVPGFSFIICKKTALDACKGRARSLSLDLYDQWRVMDKDGKWRFTSPTHVVLAFAQALRELDAEGGIPARYKRYRSNNRLLVSRMKAMGFKTYIDEKVQGPIITTFYCPDIPRFDFSDMYTYIKKRGYAIYPGKVTDADTFRIGNIGEIYPGDMVKVTDIIGDYLEELRKKG